MRIFILCKQEPFFCFIRPSGRVIIGGSAEPELAADFFKRTMGKVGVYEASQQNSAVMGIQCMGKRKRRGHREERERADEAQ